MATWEIGTVSPQEAMPKAKAAALKALSLDDTLSEAHASLAYVKLHYARNRERNQARDRGKPQQR